jgi:hypothetical protein
VFANCVIFCSPEIATKFWRLRALITGEITLIIGRRRAVTHAAAKLSSACDTCEIKIDAALRNAHQDFAFSG